MFPLPPPDRWIEFCLALQQGALLALDAHLGEWRYRMVETDPRDFVTRCNLRLLLLVTERHQVGAVQMWRN